MNRNSQRKEENEECRDTSNVEKDPLGTSPQLTKMIDVQNAHRRNLNVILDAHRTLKRVLNVQQTLCLGAVPSGEQLVGIANELRIKNVFFFLL